MSITPVACTLLRVRLRKGVCRKPCFCTALLRVGSFHSLQALDVEISLVSLVDNNRQWFKSAYGLGVEETARDLAFCGWTILANPTEHAHVMVVEDALQVGQTCRAVRADTLRCACRHAALCWQTRYTLH